MNRAFKSILSVTLAGLLSCGWNLHSAITTLPGGGFYFPSIVPDSEGSYGFASATLDAADEKLAMIFVVPEDGNIHSVRFRVQVVTTDDQLFCAVKNVTSANPDMTSNYGGMSTGTVTTSGAGIYTCNLATDATSNKGDVVAFVVGFNAYVAGNLTISNVNAVGGGSTGFPTSFHYTTSWAKLNTVKPAFSVGYDDGTYKFIPGTFNPAASSSSYTPFTIDSATTPDEIALYFKLPIGYSACGFAILFSAADYNSARIKLYDSDGTTVLSTHTVLTQASGNNITGNRHYLGDFDSCQTLSANTYYRLSVEATDSDDLYVANMVSDSTETWNQGFAGADVYLSTRTNAGSWSENTTQRPVFSIRIGGIDTAGSGGAKGMFFMD